ncbi:hypothetical protein OTU49_017296 [Cherax quadricarinatus]|uniref:Sushi domain-containing protein n=2 Tax=Cherax quadricarinatus TaxID=27406 RepID=A0AAW0Y7Q2_CHEQU
MGGAYLTPNMDHTCLPPEGGMPLHLSDGNSTTVSKCTYLAKMGDREGQVLPCTHWSFNKTTYDNTLTSEFELVCDYDFLRPTYSSVYFFSACLAAPLSGWLSDR